MVDRDLIIAISAFSGLAGALLTQLMTGIFSYYADKRKDSIAVRRAFRNKKIEVGENFYYLNGETMALLKKSIDYWMKRSQLNSVENIEFIGKEVKHTEELIAKAYAENWKYNLVTLYFDVKLSISEINEENIKSHSLFIRIREIAELIKHAPEEELEFLYGEYSFKTLDLISQYEHVYQLLKQDMEVVKRELLKEFK
ncbi:hypothetical protein [Mucilaginibacter agri]|uniref:Uncharacterized protein n=1 Tax=Mucilaginibacter agri TaxID=2695265 RepID=A0A966DT03_9SPHI|nr:hypothetical protein [Mucilaginibacter agri]NCD70135.1 hypothetical protein [Mucilaginibacter agri]